LEGNVTPPHVPSTMYGWVIKNNIILQYEKSAAELLLMLLMSKTSQDVHDHIYRVLDMLFKGDFYTFFVLDACFGRVPP
jgi:hypothetical protein